MHYSKYKSTKVREALYIPCDWKRMSIIILSNRLGLVIVIEIYVHQMKSWSFIILLTDWYYLRTLLTYNKWKRKWQKKEHAFFVASQWFYFLYKWFTALLLIWIFYFCRYSPFLMACFNPETEEYQSVCRVMSGFSDSFYIEV